MAAPLIPTPRAAAPAMTGPMAFLVDEMLDWYVEWGVAALAAADAYRLWSASPTGQKAARFAAYMAALEEEEYAANAYAEAYIKITTWR